MGCTARFENLTILKWSLKGIPWNSQEKIAIFSWARRCLVLRRSRRLSVGKNLEQLETDGQQWIGIWINFVLYLYIYIYIWTRENQSGLCKADLDILVYNLRVNDCECDGKYPRLALLQLGDFLFFSQMHGILIIWFSICYLWNMLS